MLGVKAMRLLEEIYILKKGRDPIAGHPCHEGVTTFTATDSTETVMSIRGTSPMTLVFKANNSRF